MYLYNLLEKKYLHYALQITQRNLINFKKQYT